MKYIAHIICTLLLVTLLGGCGGGSSVSGGGGTTTLTGVVAKGLFTNGTVIVYALVNGEKDRLLGQGIISNQGGYTISFSSYAGPVLLEATGNYLDEISGATLPAGGQLLLRAAVSNATGTMTVCITPLTEVAVDKAQQRVGKLTPLNIDYANNLVENIYKISDILQVVPVPYTLQALQTASAEAREYTLVLAAISQLALNRTTTAGGIINLLKADLAAGDIMSGTLAAELRLAINTVNSMNISLTDLGTIGDKRIGLRFNISNTAVNIAGASIILFVPSNYDIPTLLNSHEVQSGYVIAEGSARTAIVVAGFDSQTRELSILMTASPSFTAGDILTVYFNIPAGATHPPSGGYLYKDLTVVDYISNQAVSAVITARDVATGGTLQLSPSL